MISEVMYKTSESQETRLMAGFFVAAVISPILLPMLRLGMLRTLRVHS